MSNEIDLKVTRGLDLLEHLKQATAEFSRKEDALIKDLRSRRYNVEKKHRGVLEGMETSLSARTANLQEEYLHKVASLKKLHSDRSVRIEKARSTGLRTLPQRVKDTRGRFLGNLQMQKMRADKQRASEMGVVDSAYAQASGMLKEQADRIKVIREDARRLCSGYSSLAKSFHSKSAEIPRQGEPEEFLEELKSTLGTAESELADLHKPGLARLFSIAPLFILIPVVVIAAVAAAYFIGSENSGVMVGVGIGVVLLALIFGLYIAAAGQLKGPATKLARTLQTAGGLRDAVARSLQAQREEVAATVEQTFQKTSDAIQEKWNTVDQVEADFARTSKEKLVSQAPRAAERNEALLKLKLQKLEADHNNALYELKREADPHHQTVRMTRDEEITAMDNYEASAWAKLEQEWLARTEPLYAAIAEMNAAPAAQFPNWTPAQVNGWTPPKAFINATRFGHMDLDLNAQPEKLAADSRLRLPGPPQVSVPLALTFPDQGSILFETPDSDHPEIVGTLNNVVLRLLATIPPGKVAFTIIDPVGLGKNFAGLMNLGDYEDAIINRRIWTQRDQIDERLDEMNEHLEKVIQMYLRNEYATITEYNEQAGSVAEKYHFLVVADFPTNFSESAAKRLQSIASSGGRCGVFTLIHWDERLSAPDGFVADELRKHSITLKRDKNAFSINGFGTSPGTKLTFDVPPPSELEAQLVHKIGKSSVDSNRVEVPFSQIAPKPGEYWTNETTTELRIAVGRTGATKLQMLAIGKGTRQHALFAGKTGSGKSTLFHVIISNLALACSPEQVEFYLIDFKKGVEFKCYATKKLPHAKVVAIESDREFALSVLQRVDEELKRRGDMFRKLGVQDVAGYKRAGGKEPMPRSLLLIDEFQEFYVEDDIIAQTASVLFDRIVRQGRAFGIHVLLGSQTLGGAYTLAKATLGQMVIRVALQCNEADAYLIMDDNNPAPRLLSRPGEGIYNDAAGSVEGNSPFQVVWLPDEERDEWLDKVNELAEASGKHYEGPIVFEGNAPAEIRENYVLETIRSSVPASAPLSGRMWLGAPNSIKGPTEVVFNRQSGNHLLIIGQRDDAILTMLGVGVTALGAQYPVGSAKFYFFSSAAPGSSDAEFIDHVIRSVPHEVSLSKANDVADAVNEISEEFKLRSAGEASPDAPAIYIFIHGLQRFKKLRNEDEFDFSLGDSDLGPNTGAQLNKIISEGSSLGIHLIVTIDTFNNINRFMNRKALTEFEMRVVFQMSANDSASLIDSPRASDLGLHRALFYNEHEGSLETFRPYAQPTDDWFEESTKSAAS